MSNEVQDSANAVETVSDVAAVAGMVDVAEGMEALDAAEAVGQASRDALETSASDLTRGIDAAVVAGRAAAISKIVADAGIDDIAEGAEMLAASDDLAVQSALVSSLGAEDLETSMDIAAISGQLDVVAQVVAQLDMPVLAEFLEDKSMELQDLAIDGIFRAGATRALAASVDATGSAVGELGANEIAEGLTRIAVSEGVAIRSEELSEASDELIASGVVGRVVADSLQDTAKDMAAEGVAQAMTGSAELGASEALGEVGDAMEQAADEN
jgi:hypothetical protein